jgi:hypothetical protein
VGFNVYMSKIISLNPKHSKRSSGKTNQDRIKMISYSCSAWLI